MSALPGLPEVRAAAVVVAAGRGERMGKAGEARPKQLLEVAGEPLIVHTLRALCRAPRIAALVVVGPPEPAEVFHELRHLVLEERGRFDAGRPEMTITLVPGGPRRQDSARRGLWATPESAPVVLVHDGVRPLVSPEEIAAVIEAAHQLGCAVLASPVVHTVKREVLPGSRRVGATLDRQGLWLAQTPQGFRRPLALELFRRAAAEGWEVTDEASLGERAGLPVALVPGSPYNIKVTNAADLAVVERLLSP